MVRGVFARVDWMSNLYPHQAFAYLGFIALSVFFFLVFFFQSNL